MKMRAVSAEEEGFESGSGRGQRAARPPSGDPALPVR